MVENAFILYVSPYVWTISPATRVYEYAYMVHLYINLGMVCASVLSLRSWQLNIALIPG